MKSIILAAGQGTRLKSLTQNIPKCLVSIFGKPLIEWQLDVFRHCNISDISIVRGYQKKKISYSNITYFENPDFMNTNMVETLFCAKEKFDDDIIISYGDIIFESYILQKLIDSPHDISVVVDKKWISLWKKRFDNPLDDAESLSYNNNGDISSIGQKVLDINEISAQYIGLIKFKKNTCQKIIEHYKKLHSDFSKQDNISGFKKMYMTDFLQSLIDFGYSIKPVIVENGWLELDSLNDYELYNKMFENNTLSDFINLNNSDNNK